MTDDCCDCPRGKCASFFNEDDRGQCVNRLSGQLSVEYCSRCCDSEQTYCWHQNGQCLPCRRQNLECWRAYRALTGQFPPRTQHPMGTLPDAVTKALAGRPDLIDWALGRS